MYFRVWIHSWTCKNCPAADSYWRLRAFWAGRKRKCGMPKRCPDPQLWHNMWELGTRADVDGLDF